MKHKSWFRLVIKAIGVLVLAFGLPELIQQSAVYVTSHPGAQWPLMADPLGVLVWLIRPGLQCAIGLYLCLGGKWIVDRCIPSNRTYCPECGYDLSQSNSARCPECGVTLPAQSL